jgi:hypothetical protein
VRGALGCPSVGLVRGPSRRSGLHAPRVGQRARAIDKNGADRTATRTNRELVEETPVSRAAAGSPTTGRLKVPEVVAWSCSRHEDRVASRRLTGAIERRDARRPGNSGCCLGDAARGLRAAIDECRAKLPASCASVASLLDVLHPGDGRRQSLRDRTGALASDWWWSPTAGVGVEKAAPRSLLACRSRTTTT